MLGAPFSGIVADRYVDNFQMVQADAPIVTLQDLESIELIIALPEKDLARARSVERPRIRARFDGLEGRTYAVTLKEVATRADPQTQTYSVTFVMVKPKELLLLPGMTAEILIDLEGGANDVTLFSLPTSALTVDNSEGHSVWRVDETDLTVHRVAVTAEGYKGTQVLVKGLSAGDRIVTAGVTLLSEGDKVSLFKESN